VSIQKYKNNARSWHSIWKSKLSCFFTILRLKDHSNQPAIVVMHNFYRIIQENIIEINFRKNPISNSKLADGIGEKIGCNLKILSKTGKKSIYFLFSIYNKNKQNNRT